MMHYPSTTLGLLLGKASANCTRSFLKSAANDYVSAQRSGNLSTFLVHTAPKLDYTENNVALPITHSTLATPNKIDYHYSAYDTSRCATFTELVAATDPHPYIIHTRMEFAPNDGKASFIESVVTDRGDWLFNATTALEYITSESWSPIPANKQDSREVVQSIGDLYFDRFGNASVVVPWGPPCYRVEGGLFANGTLHNDTGVCEQVYPSTIHVPYRRYVVDEEVGVVDVFVGFPGLDRTQGKDPMPDSHMFRIEDGRIKFLHTASSCVVPGCGEFDPDHPFENAGAIDPN